MRSWEQSIGRRDCWGNRIWVIQHMVHFRDGRGDMWQHCHWVKPLAFGIKSEAEALLKRLRQKGRDEVSKSGNLKSHDRRYRIVEVGVVDKTKVVEDAFAVFTNQDE